MRGRALLWQGLCDDCGDQSDFLCGDCGCPLCRDCVRHCARCYGAVCLRHLNHSCGEDTDDRDLCSRSGTQSTASGDEEPEREVSPRDDGGLGLELPVPCDAAAYHRHLFRQGWGSAATPAGGLDGGGRTLPGQGAPSSLAGPWPLQSKPSNRCFCSREAPFVCSICYQVVCVEHGTRWGTKP